MIMQGELELSDWTAFVCFGVEKLSLYAKFILEVCLGL